MQKRVNAKKFSEELREYNRLNSHEEIFECVWYVFNILAVFVTLALLCLSLASPVTVIEISVLCLVFNVLLKNKFELGVKAKKIKI